MISIDYANPYIVDFRQFSLLADVCYVKKS